MTIDVEDYNRRWLQAWTDKDVPRLLGFYADDVVYKDPQTAGGLTGQAALDAYLTGLFAATPPMRYDPDRVWPTADGFCGRWYCTISPPGAPQTHMRLRSGGDGRRQDHPQRGLCAPARRAARPLNAPAIVGWDAITPVWMIAALATGIEATVAGRPSRSGRSSMRHVVDGKRGVDGAPSESVTEP